MHAYDSHEPGASFQSVPQTRRLPHCPICNERVVSAQGIVLNPDSSFCYLWNCEDCGCGFVTAHSA